MASEGEFDIYQTASGYVAVTSPIRRQILETIEAEETTDLPRLVEVTGKSKPTLSNVHMRELLAQGLIEELPHATDARRKLYRLLGRRLGSSSVPMEELRGAVKQYVALSPLAYSLPFRNVLEVMAPADVPSEVVRLQAKRLGERAAKVVGAALTPRDLLSEAAAFFEREGLARPARLDFDRLELEVALLDEHAPWGDPARAAAVLGGLLEGVLEARLGAGWKAVARRPKGGRVVLTADGPRKS